MKTSAFALIKRSNTVKFFAVLVFSIFVCSFCSSFAHADTVDGLYTDSRDVRWEYSITTNDIDGVKTYSGAFVRFFDKPASMTEIILPSIEDIAAIIPDIEAVADTAYYFLLESSDETYGETKRVSTANVTKLDMTNCHDVVISNVDSILDRDTEVELVFGEGVVIGDFGPEYKMVPSPVFSIEERYDEWGAGPNPSSYYGERFVQNWDSLTDSEKADQSNYIYDTDEICEAYYGSECNGVVNNINFYDSFTRIKGVFERYNVKLTNFENVKYIGENAFYGANFDETSVDLTIASGQSVGKGAFARSNVKSISWNAARVSDSAFFDCEELETVSFGDDVTNIFSNAFAETTAINHSISFPSSLKFINSEAFRGSGVTGLVFNSALQPSEFRAFMNTNLTLVDYTNSGTEEIHALAYAFSNIKTIKFGTVKKIDFSAFQNSTIEDVVDFTDSDVETIWNKAFYRATLSGVNFDGVKKLNYASFEEARLGDEVDFSNSNLEVIPARAFKSAGLKSVKLGNVKKVIWQAFMYNIITNLDMGNVEELDSEAFSYNALHELDFPKSIRSLGGKIFLNNIGINKITVRFDTYQKTMPNRFSSSIGCEINDSDSCYSSIRLEELTILAPYGPDDVVSDNHGATPFTGTYCNDYSVGCEGYKRHGTGTIPAGFYDSTTLKNIISGSYFDGFLNIKKIVVGDGYEFIGNNAFYTYRHDYEVNQYLDEIVLPDSILGIGDHAFESVMNKFTNEETVSSYIKFGEVKFKFPEHLIYVGTGAFWGCPALKAEFDLPELKFIGPNAFEQSNISDIHFYNNLSVVGENAFYYYTNPNPKPTGSDTTILEKKRNVIFDSQMALYYGGVDMYYYPARQAFGRIVFTENISNLYFANQSDKNVFFYGATFDEIDMSESSITTLPANVFNGIRAKRIILPKNLKIIGKNAFYGVQIDEELVLPNTLEVIDDDAFNAAYTNSHANASPIFPELGAQKDNQTGVKITKIPDSVYYIGKAAFYGDTNLTANIDVANLQTIGRDAFHGTGITGVVLHSGLRSVGEGAFCANTELRTIEIDADILGNVPRFGDLFGYGWVANNNRSHSVQTSELQFDSVVIKSNSLHAPLEKEVRLRTPCKYGTWMGYSDVCANEDGTRGNNRGYINGVMAFFYGFNIDTIDLEQAGWESIPRTMFFMLNANMIKLPSSITTIPDYAFYGTTVEEPVEIPSGVTTIGTEAFQYSNIGFSNALLEGVTTIEKSAFYSADIHGDFTIPSTVQSIGYSAFNATEVDTHYGTVTIKPALNYSSASNQAIFQMFWNASMDKLVIESPMLPVLGTLQAEPVMPGEVEAHTANGVETLQPQELRADGEPEFHGMTMREVEIKNLPTITADAFEECANLETVSFANHTNLQEIAQYAFNNDTKLKHFTFGDGLVGKDVALKEYAFNNTAVETIGNHNTDFDLTAANFNTVQEHVFSNMPKLKSVDIPNNFNIDTSMADETKNVNGAHITSFTFSDDPELEQVTVAYQVAEIRDGAFLNDEKLTKLFLWGNTDIQESDDLIRDFNNTTIPHGTNIFAYSDAPAENYANDDSRSAYDGKFYPLDEVLYLTSNKTYVILEQDEEGNNVDFEKDGLILYALRRDGVILESDDWQTYTKAFTRASNPNIVFEEGKGAAGNLGTDEELMWTVYDAPKPFDIISLANQNYGETNFEFIQMPSSNNPLVAIHYPDGYTAAIRTTTLASMTKEEEEEMLRELEVPNTGAFQTIASIAAPSVSIATIIVLGGIYIARRRKA